MSFSFQPKHLGVSCEGEDSAPISVGWACVAAPRGVVTTVRWLPVGTCKKAQAGDTDSPARSRGLRTSVPWLCNLTVWLLSLGRLGHVGTSREMGGGAGDHPPRTVPGSRASAAPASASHVTPAGGEAVRSQTGLKTCA